MDKQKRKNGVFQPRTRLFVVLWAMIYLVAYSGLSLVMDRLFPFRPENIRVIIVLFAALLGAMVQVQLVERLLKQSMRGWVAYSMVGVLIACFAFNSIKIGYNATAIDYLGSLIALMLPVSLLQTIWLRKYIRSAWLWALAPILTAFPLVSIVLQMRATNDMVDEVLWISGLLFYALIQGGVMRYLWAQARDTEKAKNQFAADGDHARVERLQENEDALTLHTYADEQTAQDRAR